eukprot:g1681.t1
MALDRAGIRARQGDQAFPSDPRDLDALFDFYDRDVSGALSLDEFVDLLNEWKQDVPGKEVKNAAKSGRFNPLIKEGKQGQLEKSLTTITKRQVTEFMEWVDDDGNREIDKKEFREFFTQTAWVAEMTEEMENAGQRLAAQRTTMLGYFVLMLVLWAFFLFQYMSSEEVESTGSGMGFDQVGLILTSIFLGVGVCGLLVIPIYQMHKDEIPEWTRQKAGSVLKKMQGRRDELKESGPQADAGMPKPAIAKGPKQRAMAGISDKYVLPNQRGVSAEEMAEVIAKQYAQLPEYGGPNILTPQEKLQFSYRVGKMQSSPKDDPRETLDDFWRERGINTAPTGVPIEAPEDEYGDNTAHFALAVPPDELEEYLNNSRPASRAKSRGRPMTAPGFGRGHQHRGGGGPGTATPGSTARGGRPRPVDSPSPGTRRPRSRGTGGGNRSGHATPSSYRGAGGGGAERGNHRGQMQVAIAGHPFLETPRSQTGGMSMSGSMRRPQSAPMGGGLYGRSVAPTITEEGLWNDIPGYAEAEAEYQSRGPAGRPISAASNREIYTPDLYQDARRSQITTPQPDFFNPIKLGDRW